MWSLPGYSDFISKKSMLLNILQGHSKSIHTASSSILNMHRGIFNKAKVEDVTSDKSPMHFRFFKKTKYQACTQKSCHQGTTPNFNGQVVFSRKDLMTL